MEGAIDKKPKGAVEYTYGMVLTGVMVAANPLKKMDFQDTVHGAQVH